MHTGVWVQPQLWLHELRLLRLGAAVSLQAHDPGLLGESLPTCTAVRRALAHALLHRHHLPRLLLPRQLDPRYRRHVVRRTAEEGGGRRSSGRGGDQGESWIQLPAEAVRFTCVRAVRVLELRRWSRVQVPIEATFL